MAARSNRRPQIHPTSPPLICCIYSLRWHHISFSFSYINVYWSIVAFQCCVSFYCTAKWISYTCTYIPSFLGFLPIQVTIEHWVECPVLYSRFPLLSILDISSVQLHSHSTLWPHELQHARLPYYFRHSSVYMQRRQWHPTPVLLPRKSHGRRSLVSCSPWDR